MREGKTKNEDEVNDIHAGYRILPSPCEPVRGYYLFIFFSFFFRRLLARSLALFAFHFSV